jgi:hypothetical protein
MLHANAHIHTCTAHTHTFTVSSGCPATMPAHPPTVPATSSFTTPIQLVPASWGAQGSSMAAQQGLLWTRAKHYTDNRPTATMHQRTQQYAHKRTIRSRTVNRLEHGKSHVTMVQRKKCCCVCVYPYTVYIFPRTGVVG